MPMPKYMEDEEAPDTEALPAPPDSPELEPEATESTLFATPDQLEGCDVEALKPGDKLSFTVVGKDSEGGVELQYQHDGKSGSRMDQMKADLATDMAAPEEQPI